MTGLNERFSAIAIHSEIATFGGSLLDVIERESSNLEDQSVQISFKSVDTMVDTMVYTMV